MQNESFRYFKKTPATSSNNVIKRNIIGRLLLNTKLILQEFLIETCFASPSIPTRIRLSLNLNETNVLGSLQQSDGQISKIALFFVLLWETIHKIIPLEIQRDHFANYKSLNLNGEKISKDCLKIIMGDYPHKIQWDHFADKA